MASYSYNNIIVCETLHDLDNWATANENVAVRQIFTQGSKIIIVL
jgi:hypothetical protein